jgi:hypothetical protein
MLNLNPRNRFCQRDDLTDFFFFTANSLASEHSFSSQREALVLEEALALMSAKVATLVLL